MIGHDWGIPDDTCAACGAVLPADGYVTQVERWLVTVCNHACEERYRQDLDQWEADQWKSD